MGYDNFDKLIRLNRCMQTIENKDIALVGFATLSYVAQCRFRRFKKLHPTELHACSVASIHKRDLVEAERIGQAAERLECERDMAKDSVVDFVLCSVGEKQRVPSPKGAKTGTWTATIDSIDICATKSLSARYP